MSVSVSPAWKVSRRRVLRISPSRSSGFSRSYSSSMALGAISDYLSSYCVSLILSRVNDVDELSPVSFYKNIVLYMTQFWVRFHPSCISLVANTYSSTRSSTTSPAKSPTSPGHCHCITSPSPSCRHLSSVSSISSSLHVSWTDTHNCTCLARRTSSSRGQHSGFGWAMHCITAWYVVLASFWSYWLIISSRFSTRSPSSCFGETSSRRQGSTPVIGSGELCFISLFF